MNDFLNSLPSFGQMFKLIVFLILAVIVLGLVLALVKMLVPVLILVALVVGVYWLYNRLQEQNAA